MRNRYGELVYTVGIVIVDDKHGSHRVVRSWQAGANVASSTGMILSECDCASGLHVAA